MRCAPLPAAAAPPPPSEWGPAQAGAIGQGGRGSPAAREATAPGRARGRGGGGRGGAAPGGRSDAGRRGRAGVRGGAARRGGVRGLKGRCSSLQKGGTHNPRLAVKTLISTMGDEERRSDAGAVRRWTFSWGPPTAEARCVAPPAPACASRGSSSAQLCRVQRPPPARVLDHERRQIRRRVPGVRGQPAAARSRSLDPPTAPGTPVTRTASIRTLWR